MSRCDVCNGESCTRDIGVAAVPGAPMSIMWGEKCLRQPNFYTIIPTMVADYWLDEGMNLDIGVLDKWGTWADRRYMSIRDYAKHRVAHGR